MLSVELPVPMSHGDYVDMHLKIENDIQEEYESAQWEEAHGDSVETPKEQEQRKSIAEEKGAVAAIERLAREQRASASHAKEVVTNVKKEANQCTNS